MFQELHELSMKNVCIVHRNSHFTHHKRTTQYNHSAGPALTIPLAICNPKQVKLLRCGSMSGACVTGEGETEPLSSPVESLFYIGNASVVFACNNMHIIWNKTIITNECNLERVATAREVQ